MSGRPPVLYRVQDAEGRGPYRPGRSHLWAGYDHNERNPTTMQEFGPRIMEFPRSAIAGSGFLSLDALRVWFTVHERRNLAGLGYRLVALDGCTIYARGALQVMAWRAVPFHRRCRVIPWAEVLDADTATAAPSRRLDSSPADPAPHR